MTVTHRDEQERIEALASLLSVHEHDFSEHHWRKIAGRLVAFAPRVMQLLEPGPAPLARDLSQSRSNEVDSLDWWAEHCGHLKREYEHALACFERVQAAQGQAKLKDEDERGADEDDRRIAQERADDEAAANAPRVAS